MSDRIKVLLLENVASLGKAGDIVTVNEGYARNFLFPNTQAALATTDVVASKASSDRKKQKEDETKTAELHRQAENLQGTELVLTARVKEGQEIFGSITPKQIIDELKKQAGLTLKPKDIDLKQPLTELGHTDVTVMLSPEVTTTIRVTVIASQAPSRDDE